MDYTICISHTCPTCVSTLQSLKNMNINLIVKNIDTDDNSWFVSPIIPALYLGHSLIAYGNDIVKYFKS